MAPDRRVAACLLLLLASIPLLLAQLPEHVEVVVGPMGLLVLASAVILVPTPPKIVFVVWVLSTLTLVGFDQWFAPMHSWALLTILPLGVITLGQPTRWVFLAITAGTVVFAALGNAPELLAARPFAVGTPADIVGLLALAAWVCRHPIAALRLRIARRRLGLQRDTAIDLEEAIARDVHWLESVAETVADPSLKGPIRNPGVGPEQLAMAARIGNDLVLLGWIEGPVLSTLSVGWGCCAAARAGLTDPKRLLAFARTRFDEIVPAESIRWIAIWDRRHRQLRVAGAVNPGQLGRYVLTSHGPAEIGPQTNTDTHQTVRELLGEYDASALVGQTLILNRAPLFVGCALSLLILAAVPWPLPGPTWILLATLLALAEYLIGKSLSQGESLSAEARVTLRERAEMHDDLRCQLASAHGTLLEYQIQIGEASATAHRLRGEVLDGAFADMLVDSTGIGRIIAGEIAGRGIAARFLGMAAQIIARVMLEPGHGAPPPDRIAELTVLHLKTFGSALQFPVRLRLGVVTCTTDGRCEGSGSLCRLVQRTQDDARAAVHTAIVDRAALDPGTRVYLTPAPALPGPEDRAPALSQTLAADRVAGILRSPRWNPSQGTLPSLFSLVFDGVHAPAHGTLIELLHLGRLSEEQHQEENDDEHGAHTQGAQPFSLA